RYQIPIPNRVVGGARDKLEAFFAASQLILGLFPFGNVLTYSNELQGFMAFVEHPLSLAMKHSNGSVGTDNPLLKLKRFALTKGLLNNRPSRSPIFRMNTFEVTFE